jgi:hypothetical protein
MQSKSLFCNNCGTSPNMAGGGAAPAPPNQRGFGPAANFPSGFPGSFQQGPLQQAPMYPNTPHGQYTINPYSVQGAPGVHAAAFNPNHLLNKNSNSYGDSVSSHYQHQQMQIHKQQMLQQQMIQRQQQMQQQQMQQQMQQQQMQQQKMHAKKNGKHNVMNMQAHFGNDQTLSYPGNYDPHADPHGPYGLAGGGYHASFDSYAGQSNRLIDPAMAQLAGTSRLDNMNSETKKLVEMYKQSAVESPNNGQMYGNYTMYDATESLNGLRKPF